MHKALDVIGLPIICLQTGETIGSVRDILCDLEWHVLGIVLSESNWFQSGTFIPVEHIHAVGEDFLTVAGKDTISSLQQIAEATVGLVCGKNKLKGKSVITEDGKFLGKIEDVYFSTNWEKLVAYELSNGWIADVTSGRKRLSAPASLVFGEENLIVPNSIRMQA
ncbi:PRC-barrel domain-containing protein [Brevibacillus fulvus]|uniref:Uncharacterized protein YrrD n=1 Tax=Brevibacillus fulvus TaxID=1125967 RepID=A0A938XYH1_9BACL|nr:PRC-barrel domain-containing protein [Brevibacillus fulvus]MBM7589963.1 uncharacterized protein YrrD [Brevibacillus fulvus]